MVTNAAHPTSMSAAPGRPERLTPDDDLFVRMEHAMGLPVINQAVWRLPTRLDPARFTELGAALTHGRMSRLVVRCAFPLRDRWVHTPDAGRHAFADEQIDAADGAGWALAQANLGIDSVTGPSWRMSAITTRDTDETFVSWVSSHVIGDGGAVITGIGEVLDGIGYDATDADPGMLDTVREGADALRTSAVAAYRLARHRTRPAPLPRPTAPDPAVSAEDWGGVSPTVIVTIPEGTFDAVAQRAGGTANTLFTAIVIGILEASGAVADGDEIPVNLPVSTRIPGDRRANASTGVTARVRVSPALRADLTPLRTASKTAFASATGAPSSLALLGRLAQPLGDSIVRRLAADSRAPLCLASNLGTLDAGFAGLGTGLPGSVAMRSMTVGASRDVLRRMAGGISGWSSRSAGHITLCITALDPDRVANTATLTSLVAEELSRWDLRGSFWGTGPKE